MRPEISLADVIRAIRELDPDPEAVRRLLPMLGFELDAPLQAPESRLETGRLPSLPPQYKPKSRRSDFAGKVIANLSVEVIKEGRSQKSSSLVMPEPIKGQSEEGAPPPKYLPLFETMWSRAIITKMLSVKAADSLPDIQRLIEILSRNQPLKDVPRRLSPSLRKGAQVLIDRGPGMTPFIRDQIFLLEQLGQIVGEDRLDVWGFVGTPLRRAFSRDVPASTSYRLPPEGTPILLLTDLGIAAPPFETEVATPMEWARFARYARTAGGPLLALTPYPRRRWPRAVRESMTVIQWDFRTSVLSVQKALG